MEGHTIRLRGGWDCRALAGDGTGSIRLALPAAAGSLPAGRLRLTRRFRRPPRAPEAGVVLRVSRCPGIHSVLLNGRPVGPASPEASEFEVALGPLEPSNALEIEAEPPAGAEEWGVIALVFR